VNRGQVMSAITATTSAPPSPGVAVPPPLPVRRFTVDEYHRMIAAGILGEDDNVELLEGWIVPKMPRTPPHDGMISIIMLDVLTPRLPADYHCRGRSAVTTTDSEPEPDIAVVRGPKRVFLARHPGPADMRLVVEVADSSLERDRSHKSRIYASANIPVYWIVNLVDVQVEVYTDPTGPDPAPAYRTRRIYRPGDPVPFVLDGRDLGPIPAQDLLP
jgi:Putative restriction endonuclease